jgi:hypothetical protein
MDRTADVPRDRRIIFVKSWNEWAEGNHLEPDLRFGHAYLEVIRNEAMGRQHHPLPFQNPTPSDLPPGQIAPDRAAVMES